MTKKKSETPEIDNMRVGGPTEGTDALKPADEIRPQTMHEEVVARVQAEQDAKAASTNPQREDTKNPTTYGDYKDKGDSPKVGDSVFYIVQDGASKGAFRPAIVVANKGDVCELCVLFSSDDDGGTARNVGEVSRSDSDTVEFGTWISEIPK